MFTSGSISTVISVSSCVSYHQQRERLCIVPHGSFLNANEALFLSLKITFKTSIYIFKPQQSIKDRQQTQSLLELLLQSCFSAEKNVPILKPAACQPSRFLRKTGCDGEARSKLTDNALRSKVVEQCWKGGQRTQRRLELVRERNTQTYFELQMMVKDLGPFLRWAPSRTPWLLCLAGAGRRMLQRGCLI